MTEINTALCSYGMSGRVFHEPLLRTHSGFFVSRILSRSHTQFPGLDPSVRIDSDYEEILNDPKVELVVVNLPDPLHKPYGLKALEAGKHVVMEKPFTLTVSEGEELIQKAREKNGVLAVFQNRRWDSDFLTVCDLVDQGALGEIKEFEAHFDRFRPIPPRNTWKEDKEMGTGVLYNLGSHLIDQALVLFGWPEAVWADIDRMRNPSAVTDYFMIELVYPNRKVWLHSSYLVAEPGPKFILHGTGGSFYKWGQDVQEAQLNQGITPDYEGYGIEPEEMAGNLFQIHDPGSSKTIIPSRVGNYAAFYDQIYRAIREDQTEYVDAEQGLQVIRIIAAAKESQRTGRRIELNAIPR